MSFDYLPSWTNNITVPSTDETGCPVCGKPGWCAAEAASCLTDSGAYISQHIPDYLLLACSNQGCKNCDVDYKVYLKVRIEITHITAFN